MAAGIGKVKLKLPEKALREMLKRYGDDVLPVINDSFAAAADQALVKMVEIAPLDTGELEASGRITARVSPRGRRAAAEFRFDTPYASIVHEMPMSSRGPGTRGKAGNEFGPAGPKYIERVLRGFKLGPIVGRALRDFWRRAGKVG